jgi:LCP family protein required for cell wall assembly
VAGTGSEDDHLGRQPSVVWHEAEKKMRGIASSVRRRLVTPGSAAWLSLILPGLGQLLAGRRLRAALLALPAIGIAVGTATVALQAPTTLLELFAAREFAVGLVILNLAVFGYHAFAIADAYQLVAVRRATPGRIARTLSAGALLVAMVTATLGHAAVGVLGYRTAAAVTEVFAPSEIDGGIIPEPGFDDDDQAVLPSAPATPLPTPPQAPSLSPASSSPSSSPAPTPDPTPRPRPGWARDGRLNLLLIGSDAGPDRWSLRTDTMIVLSVDVATGRAALFGIPRNLVGVPLAPESAGAVPNGRFPGLLNALYVYATGHPRDFPGGQTRGLRAVAGAVQELVHQRLDGMVVVNLRGFVRLVDAVGGLWIDVPERLVDRMYPLSNGALTTLDIGPGCQRMAGERALAYARSRHQDSDYGRMRRQQLVLVALRRQLDPATLLPRLPELLDIAGDSLWTTLKPSAIRGIAELADRVKPRLVDGYVFSPPRYPSHLTDAAIARIRFVVGRALRIPSTETAEWGTGRCPR